LRQYTTDCHLTAILHIHSLATVAKRSPEMSLQLNGIFTGQMPVVSHIHPVSKAVYTEIRKMTLKNRFLSYHNVNEESTKHKYTKNCHR